MADRTNQHNHSPLDDVNTFGVVNRLCSCLFGIAIYFSTFILCKRLRDSLHVCWLLLCWHSCFLFVCSLFSSGVNRITYWPQGVASLPHKCQPPSPPLNDIRVMVIVWRLRGNIMRTAPCWVVGHNVHSQQHTYMSSSYRSSRLGLSHRDPYAMHRGSCLEWCWWDLSHIWKINWLPSVLWHCWFGHMTCKNRPRCDL